MFLRKSHEVVWTHSSRSSVRLVASPEAMSSAPASRNSQLNSLPSMAIFLSGRRRETDVLVVQWSTTTVVFKTSHCLRYTRHRSDKPNAKRLSYVEMKEELPESNRPSGSTKTTNVSKYASLTGNRQWIAVGCTCAVGGSASHVSCCNEEVASSALPKAPAASSCSSLPPNKSLVTVLLADSASHKESTESSDSFSHKRVTCHRR